MSDVRAGADWRLYIQDMIDFSEKVLTYTTGMDIATFVSDSLVYDATLRNLELIGEAATRVPTAIQEAHTEVPWRQIVGTRNRLAHGYLGVDDDVVWDIINTDIPELIPTLYALLGATETGATKDG